MNFSLNTKIIKPENKFMTAEKNPKTAARQLPRKKKKLPKIKNNT